MKLTAWQCDWPPILPESLPADGAQRHRLAIHCPPEVMQCSLATVTDTDRAPRPQAPSIGCEALAREPVYTVEAGKLQAFEEARRNGPNGLALTSTQ